MSRSFLLGPVLGLCLSAAALHGQTRDCEPVADRAGRVLGCFITLRQELGQLPRDTALFWFIDSLPDSSTFAPVAGSRAAVVRSVGATWLFTLAGQDAPSVTGRRVQVIGPLPLVVADSFAAVYMEGVFQPGMESPVHRHPGPEAWYTVEGAQCLETPRGRLVQRAGEGGVIVPGGDPMRLTGVGTGVRRSLILILQDATKPRNTHATDWTPKNLCRNL
jgi:quercetin dioxygenase-like cupin family protein